MALLEVRGLTKQFSGLTAILRVDLDVHEGEIFGLIGPNGAGKTTLFNMISGRIRPTSGSIRFRGRDITTLPPHQVTGLGVCRTHQVVRPFRDLTVAENVMVGVRYGRRPKSGKTAEREVNRLLEAVGLGEMAHMPSGRLSTGNLKRLEIARSLATAPELLLLDEVCGGLNHVETAQTMELLRTIRAAGTTLFYVEHNMQAIMQVCDRIMVLDYGQKLAEGSPDEIVSNPDVIAAYLGQQETA